MKEQRRQFLKKIMAGGVAVSAVPHLLTFGGSQNTQREYDYAKMENMSAWLRHPVLGDPSFDTFEKLGATVHQSEPPYEWAVNGSLFCDPADGAWYYFAGLYGYGYGGKMDFKIYKSTDSGKSWQDLGTGFPDGFCFDGYSSAADSHPDAVMTYDPETKLYWLAYDWGTNDSTWAEAHHPSDKNYDGGAALAYSQSPAGPFTRLSKPIFGNYEISRKLGRFTRAYATTVLKRKSDWIALTLCDSGEYFSWGLICLTAESPEGNWSEPKVLLSVDRPEYYPAPVEFYPCFAVGETVYAPATSVALNRNYQAMFTAPLEEAHHPEAWVLSGDGNAWHSRPLPDEKFGIWGQTYHGFVDKTSGKFTVMYPSRDERGFGTLSVAQRLWDKPHSNGFTFSGHEGKSVSPLMRAYKNFTLEMELTFTGTIEIAFDYNGILGPETPTANSSPSHETLADYQALRLSGGNFQLVSINSSGEEMVVSDGGFPQNDTKVNLSLTAKDKDINLIINGVAKNIPGISVKGGSLALIAHNFSILTCSKYMVYGEPIPCSLKYQAYDAILGAGQRLANWRSAVQSGLSCISEKALINAVEQHGAVKIYGKWNICGNGFTLYAPKGPTLGTMRVVVDGEHQATVDLYSENNIASSPVSACKLTSGHHGIAIYPEKGEIVLDVLEVDV
jgi:hypothetical protein